MLGWLAAIALAAGAAPEPPASVCASALDALPAQPFIVKAGKNSSTEFVLDTHGRCLHVDDHDEPALLIRLEPSAQPMNVKVISVSGKESTLPARIVLLDEHFGEVRSYPFERFVKRGMNYSTTVFLEPATTVRYLLARPDHEWVGKQNQLTQGNRWTAFWATPTVMGTISNGNEVKRSVPFTVFGTVRLELEEETRLIDPAKR